MNTVASVAPTATDDVNTLWEKAAERAALRELKIVKMRWAVRAMRRSIERCIGDRS